MRNKVKIIILALMLASALIPSASALNVTTDNQSRSSWNETFSGNQNNTLWFNVSSAVVNATLNVSGYRNIITIMNETPDSASCSANWDAGCGGCGPTNDNSFSTSCRATGIGLVATTTQVFLTPSGATDAIIKTKGGSQTGNITASSISDCFHITNITLYAYSINYGGSNFGFWVCLNSTGGTAGGLWGNSYEIYESSIYWLIPNNSSNPYLDTASSGSPWEWSYTGEFNSSVGSKQANLNATLINNWCSHAGNWTGANCVFPIKAHSDTAGLLQFSTISLNDFSYLQANDTSTGLPLSTFTANFTNGTYTKIYFTTSGLVTASLADLPTGTTNLTITQDGYRTNNTITYNIDKSFSTPTYFNTTAQMSAASVLINTYDEKSLASLTFNVTFANSTLSKTWYNQTSFSQKYDNLTIGDTTITISSAGYTTRNYFLTITPQTYEQLNAYLLSTSLGQTVRFHIQTVNAAPISGVLATAKAFIGSAYTTVEQVNSDDSGTSTLFLDPTVTYQMIFSHPSYTTLTSMVQPSSTDYTIQMSTTANSVNITYEFGDISLYVLPSDTSIMNTTQAFNMSITSTESRLSQWGMYITNSTNTLYSGNSTAAGGGTLNTVVDLSGHTGEIDVLAYYTTTAGNTSYFMNRYYINNVTLGGNTLVDIFRTIKYGDVTTGTAAGYGMSKESLGIIGFIITALVMGFISMYTVSGAGVVGVMVLGFLAYAGIMAWSIVLATGVLVTAILLLRGVI